MCNCVFVVVSELFVLFDTSSRHLECCLKRRLSAVLVNISMLIPRLTFDHFLSPNILSCRYTNGNMNLRVFVYSHMSKISIERSAIFVLILHKALCSKYLQLNFPFILTLCFSITASRNTLCKER